MEFPFKVWSFPSRCGVPTVWSRTPRRFEKSILSGFELKKTCRPFLFERVDKWARGKTEAKPRKNLDWEVPRQNRGWEGPRQNRGKTEAGRARGKTKAKQSLGGPEAKPRQNRGWEVPRQNRGKI